MCVIETSGGLMKKFIDHLHATLAKLYNKIEFNSVIKAMLIALSCMHS